MQGSALEPITLKNIGNDDSSSSLITSTSGGVTVRNGRVRDFRLKSKIPTWHKYLIICVICALCVCSIWVIYATKDESSSLMFGAADEDDTEEQHERKVGWEERDWAGFVVASLLICVAAGGGIGGGGVLVPTYIFVLGFDPKYAIPLSNCTILGSSLSNLILNVNKRHPFADRPCIDWDIMLMMEPLTIAGALLGTFINVISPPWLITIFLVILLTATAVKTLKKGFKQYAAETAALKEKENQESIDLDKMEQKPNSAGYMALGDLEKDEADEQIKSVLSWDSNDVRKWWQRSLPPGCQQYIHIIDDNKLSGEDLLQIDEEMLTEFDVKKMLRMKICRHIKHLKASIGLDVSTTKLSKEKTEVSPYEEDERMQRAKTPELRAIYEGERYHVPWKVAIMFITTVVIVLLNVLKGNGGNINPLDISLCTPLYWVLTIATFPFVFVICFIARNHLLKVFAEKEKHGYEYLDEDVRWNRRATVRYPLICSIAGLCAGMFGIGGGIVKGPLMLEMGVLPNVASATSATMILFTSSGASVSYLLFQQLNLNYAAVLFCLGIVFTLIGQKTLSVLVKKYKRNSLIVLVIGVTVALSAILMSIQSSGALIDLFEGKAQPGGDICEGGAGGE